jgi:acyl-CoA thioesterase I
MAAARLLLYLLISGHAFFIGLALVTLSVVVGRRWPILASALLWLGLGLTLASAMPAQPAGLFALFAGAAGWRLSLLGARALLRRGLAMVLLAVVAGLGAAEILTRDGRAAALAVDRLVVIGDSLSAASGGSRMQTWPDIAAARYGFSVVNLAQAGATLASAQSQVQRIPSGTAAVLVELGGNDLLAGTNTERFAADLRALLASLTAPHRQVRMFELPLLPFQASYGRIQRRVCRGLGVRLLPRSLLAGAVALPGHTTDGLHLSPAGHAWLAVHLGRWLSVRRGDAAEHSFSASGKSVSLLEQRSDLPPGQLQ